MNILLINPEVPNTFWSFKNVLRFISKKSLLPPLGLLTVAAMLPEQYEKKLIDLNTDNLKDRDIQWADYVFLTGMVIQKKSVDEIIHRCNRLNAKIVAGGPLFNTMPELYPTIDHIIMKEGEITLKQFLHDLEAGEPRRLYTTREFPDLHNTPIPQWNLIDTRKYALMCVQYSRGCPFNCDFCDVTKLFGHAIRTKTTDQVLKELDSLYAMGWRREVFFVDDNFIGRKKELKETLLPALIGWMQQNNYPFSFNTQASINLADDEELMDMMVEAGFNCIFVGIESPNEVCLSECNKIQNTGRDLVACIKKIQQRGLEVQGGFILGFDSDNHTVFDNLIAMIQESGIVTAMVGLLNAPRGTELYKRLVKEHRISRIPTGDNTDCTINFIPKMDLNDLLNGYKKVVDTIYSQKYFSERVMTFLKNYKVPEKAKFYFRYRDIKALFKSIWHIGILGKGRRYYWKLIFWSMQKRSWFRMAVAFSIYGFHFRKTFKGMQVHIEELAKSQPVTA